MAAEDLPDPIAVALAFVDILDRLGSPYLIGGSLASSVYGEPRSTNDVDVIADLRLEQLSPLIEALGPGYYVSADAARTAMIDESSFNVIEMDTAVKVDLFVAGSDPFNAERLRCRQRVPVSLDPPRHLWIDAAEHSILRKLDWFRRGGGVSDRQWRDVVAILRVQRGVLDEARLEGWAARLGITDLLEEARRDAAGVD